MTNREKGSIFLLRITLGWMFFYAGITKVLDPTWSAAGYLKGAKTFPLFYNWLLQPNILPVINFINEWGLVLLGVSLIIGLGIRLSSILGSVLMILYYLPLLQFPYPNAHSFFVDEHIIYIAALLVLASIKAGQVWGLGAWCTNCSVCKKYPLIKKILC